MAASPSNQCLFITIDDNKKNSDTMTGDVYTKQNVKKTPGANVLIWLV